MADKTDYELDDELTDNQRRIDKLHEELAALYAARRDLKNQVKIRNSRSPKNPERLQRNIQICREYLDGDNTTTLAERYRLSKPAVVQILWSYGIPSPIHHTARSEGFARRRHHLPEDLQSAAIEREKLAEEKSSV
jgi:uncharacterized coiled-coil protein SlyX